MSYLFRGLGLTNGGADDPYAASHNLYVSSGGAQGCDPSRKPIPASPVPGSGRGGGSTVLQTCGLITPACSSEQNPGWCATGAAGSLPGAAELAAEIQDWNGLVFPMCSSWQGQQISCLQQRGVPVTVDGAGNVSYSGTPIGNIGGPLVSGALTSAAAIDAAIPSLLMPNPSAPIATIAPVGVFSASPPGSSQVASGTPGSNVNSSTGASAAASTDIVVAGFDLSTVPWWGWALAAAGLYMLMPKGR